MICFSNGTPFWGTSRGGALPLCNIYTPLHSFDYTDLAKTLQWISCVVEYENDMYQPKMLTPIIFKIEICSWGHFSN